MIRPVKKAVFPVAGLGTRFLPASKAVPKEMLPIVDKPLIQYAVEEAAAAGIEEFIFVTGRDKGAIEDHFDHSYELEAELAARGKTTELEALKKIIPPAGSLSFTRQQEPLGLGHAVWCARHLVGGEPFAVFLVDELVLSETPCMKQVVDLYDERGGCVYALAEIPIEQSNRYGIVDAAADDGRIIDIKGMVEKPAPGEAPSNLCIIGRYVLQPEVFDYLERMERTVGGEIQLTDALARMIGGDPFHGFRYDGKRFDCGDKVGFIQANIAFALARDDLRGGVSAYLKTLNLGA
ncbi:MAG: UTP--glucose-1-phosphate uridylyltransferase GalU [Alphaproteobacteria bacterium]|nr:UTP--glucose-1-phosphate uridylyltransferase GalU [Alphaproteobacteria bacterium]